MIFNFGVPINVGGANTQITHFLLLMRKIGVDVTCLTVNACPCGKQMIHPSPQNPSCWRLLAAGVHFQQCEASKLSEVPGLAGSIVTANCNAHAVHCWPALRDLGCKFVWSPAMNFFQAHEQATFPKAPPTALVCESAYQESCIGNQYREWGTKQVRIIPGAFEQSLFEYDDTRRREGEPFVVCRIARPSRQKWSPYLWPILENVRRRGIDLKFIGLGWGKGLDQWCGKPPEWARCIPPDGADPRDVLAKCHAMICPNENLPENWPRVGLEAFATGVPVVADACGGWMQQVIPGVTGYLCRNPGDYVHYLVKLATDEDGRLAMAQQAHEHLKTLADPEKIGGMWREFLQAL